MQDIRVQNKYSAHLQAAAIKKVIAVHKKSSHLPGEFNRDIRSLHTAAIMGITLLHRIESYSFNDFQFHKLL